MSIRVADLTTDELRALMREIVIDVLQEWSNQAEIKPFTGKRAPLNIPVVDVGPWPENLSLRREDMYSEDER